MMAGQRLVLGASLLAVSLLGAAPLWAATDPTQPIASGSGFAALMQGLLGLVVVLGALFVFFWLLRRFSPGQTGAQGAVKVVGGVMLGTREKLVVVEVGDQWLLLGVGAGQVNHLHTMPRPANVPTLEAGASTAPLPASFAAKLTEFLARRKAN